MKSLPLLVALLAASAHAQEPDKQPAPSMTVGDPAPAIDIEHWVIGDKVDTLDKGKVYVVEFWATWCGPCIRSMPHISELQQHYGDDVTFIGVSDEDLETVTTWLDKEHRTEGVLNRERIQYRLTTDPDESVKRDYFRAAGRTGIPSAFVVGKEGLIEWIGHPMSIDDVLAGVTAGTWDRAAFKAAFEVEQAAKAKQRAFQQQLSAAKKAGDVNKQIALIEEAVSDAPQNATRYEPQLLQLFAQSKPHHARALALATKLFKRSQDDPMSINSVAWTIAGDAETNDPELLAMCLKATTRGLELSEWNNAYLLDTHARVYFQMGKLAEAIEWQKKAIAASTEERLTKSLEQTLATYENSVDRG